MPIVEACDVSDTGREFCFATYASEGNISIVFSFYMIFNKLELFVNGQLILGLIDSRENVARNQPS